MDMAYYRTPLDIFEVDLSAILSSDGLGTICSQTVQIDFEASTVIFNQISVRVLKELRDDYGIYRDSLLLEPKQHIEKSPFFEPMEASVIEVGKTLVGQDPHDPATVEKEFIPLEEAEKAIWRYTFGDLIAFRRMRKF